MSAVVGGTHVCHVRRLAGGPFTWRSGHRGTWQMFAQSWRESQGSREQSEAPDKLPTTTASTENEEPALHFHQSPSMGQRE